EGRGAGVLGSITRVRLCVSRTNQRGREETPEGLIAAAPFSAGGSGEEFANPGALGRIRNGLSAAVLQVRTHAKIKEGFDDFALRIDRRLRAASAASGILHGQMKRGGAGFVPDGRVTA